MQPAEPHASASRKPGVWEVTVEARRTSDVEAAPFTLTMSILGATVSPNPDIIASATIGVPVARSYTATNLFGAFTGRMVGTTLGSAQVATSSIADLEQQQYRTTVTAGTTSFRATIGGTVRSGGRPRPVRVQLHDAARVCSPGSPPTATPRNR